MALLFDDASSQFLKHNAVVKATAPLTMSAWFYADDLANTGYICSVCLRSTAAVTTIYGLRFRGDQGGDPISAQYDGNVVLSSNSVSANTWHHGAAVFASTSSRSVYLDGTKASTADTVNVSGATSTYIGAIGYNNTDTAFFSGRIAEVAIWGVALNDAFVDMLATGASPLIIPQHNLLAYWPLDGRVSPERDRVADFEMTLNNAPTYADHPRVLYPSTQVHTPATVAAAAAADPLAPLAGQLRRRRFQPIIVR
jgi:hypothetical protein